MSTITATRPPFSQLLRDATADAHRAAERAPFMVALMTGELGVAAYADLLGQIHGVYQALEDAEKSAAGDVLATPFLDTRLHRTVAIEADLAALLGDDWVTQTLPLTDAAVAYAAHIRTAVDEWPSALVGHHYTRYLGDLSGGQIIARMLQRHYGFDDAALSLYRFEGIEPKPYKDAYRARLDGAPWTDQEQERVIGESMTAFDFNKAIFDQLGARH